MLELRRERISFNNQKVITMTKVIHSETKPAWNVVNRKLGAKYKLARVPYLNDTGNLTADEMERTKAFNLAKFISSCLNHETEIKKLFM